MLESGRYSNITAVNLLTGYNHDFHYLHGAFRHFSGKKFPVGHFSGLILEQLSIQKFSEAFWIF